MISALPRWPDDIDLAYEEAARETGIVQEFAAFYLKKPVSDLTFVEYCEVCEHFGFDVKSRVNELTNKGRVHRERWRKQDKQVHKLADYLYKYASTDLDSLFFEDDEPGRKKEMEELLRTSINSGTIYSVIERIGYQQRRDALTKNARIAVMARLENDPKRRAQQEVRQCWELWQKDPSRYKSKAAFARDMRDKYDKLQSDAVIARWCRTWEKDTQRA